MLGNASAEEQCHYDEMNRVWRKFFAVG